MIYVNILTGYKQLFIHQLDKKRYDGYIEFYENSTENILWDYVVVYEVIRTDITIRCKKGGLIFMSGEPEDSSPYCKKFLDQFDHVISSLTWYKRSTLHASQTALNYHYGYSFKNKSFKYDYEILSAMEPCVKVKDVSMMCSSKTMLPGHVLRYKLYQALSARFKNRIDFYGDGISFLDDKTDAINPYRFHICIENSAVPNYWTEKISDSILGYSIPIYYGATNIYEYFPQESVIWLDLKNTNRAVEQIEEILADAENIYENRLPYLKEARKLLLDKYNIFPTIEEIIKKYPNKDEEDTCVTIETFLHMTSFKLRNFRLRLRRLIFKAFNI